MRRARAASTAPGGIPCPPRPPWSSPKSNDAQQNELLAYRRDGDGGLTPLARLALKGAGSGAAHLPSQGSVALTGDGRHVFVTNAGSGDVSVVAVEGDDLLLVQTLPTGTAPRSVTEHDGLVYVLTTGEPSVVGFRREGDGYRPVPGSARALAADADPAQVGFTPTAPTSSSPSAAATSS